MDGSSLTDPLVWAQETFGAAELGDPRRTRRLVRVAAQMAADPQGSLPREMSGNWPISRRPTVWCEPME